MYPTEKEKKPRKTKIHLCIYGGGCASFVSACTLDWCYNSRLWGAAWTKEETEVTCLKCLKRVAEWKSSPITEVVATEGDLNWAITKGLITAQQTCED
jgi:hypothetical protein